MLGHLTFPVPYVNILRLKFRSFQKKSDDVKWLPSCAVFDPKFEAFFDAF